MIRIGFDIGGSKIAAIALDQRGREVARLRRDVPRDYPATLAALAELSEALQQGRRPGRSIGIGMPGLIGADGVLIRVVNLPWLEGRPLRGTCRTRCGVPVTIANDANCLALSEAVDGAAAGARVVFGAILGTGVGGGIVVEGKPLTGANAIAGEWGHNPLPRRARRMARRHLRLRPHGLHRDLARRRRAGAGLPERQWRREKRGRGRAPGRGGRPGGAHARSRATSAGWPRRSRA